MLLAIALLLTAGLLMVMGVAGETSGPGLRVYLGTSTKKESKGIYLAELDPDTGRMSEPTLVAEVAQPTFLAAHPSGKWLYSVREAGNPAGAVYGLAVDPATGGLTPINEQPSGGDGPCYVTVDPAGRHVLTANYGSGAVAVLPIADDGSLGEATCVVQHTGSSAHPQRQQGPHAHAIQVHPAGEFAFAADLGTNELIGYRYDGAAGQLARDDAATIAAAPGAGPRHFAFHPTLETIYLINELDSTVMALRFDAAAGRLTTMQTLTTLPDGFEGTNYPSEVAVHPSGQFLYGANRGHDSLAVFYIEPTTGELAAAGHVSIEGAFPRHFAIDPTGRWLIVANQQSDNLAIFRIDPETGVPSFTGQRVGLSTPMAVLF